jgi:PKD repeat protein
VGEPLTDPVVVEVTDSRGRPVEGASVTFELISAGPGAEIVPGPATTDANGRADTRMVLGTRVGLQTGQARVMVEEGAPAPEASFSAMALSENANGIAAVAGDDQTGRAGSILGARLVVEVTDAFGNPIPNVPISWTAEGGGSVSEAVVNTDTQGRASVERTLGPAAGRQTTLASSEGLAGSPVTFIHTATAGSAAGLSVVSGDNQTARAGTRLPAALVVRLTDDDGNGVPGAAVTWVVGTGGGSVTPQNSITDEAGLASAQWTLGSNPGENRVDAVVSGVAVAHFRATGTVGASAALAILIQPAPSARNGVPLGRQPVVQLRDARGNDVTTAGIVITAQIGSGGGDLTGTRQRATDSNGRATFTDLAISGAPGRRTLVFTASGYAGATSSEIDVQAIGTSTTITSDAPDPSVAGTPFTIDFRVTSEGPTPTGTVTVDVTDAPLNCTGVLRDGIGSCQLTLNQPGERTLRATYSGGPGLGRSSDTEGHRVNPPTPENRAPHADYNWHCEGLTCQFTDGSSDPDGAVTAWNWNFGDGTTSPAREPSHSYSAPGTYTVTLTVTDNGGATDESTAHVEVEPPPPNKAPDADFDVDCVDLTCTFTDKSKDDDGSIVSRSWNYGDGTPASGVPSHTYAAAGKYQVTLTVTDNDGAVDTKTREVEAKEPPPPPAGTTTTITSDAPDPSDQGAAITVSFTVTSPSGTPTGTVQVTDPNGGSCSGSAPSGSCSYTPGGVGTRTLTATYQENSNFSGSSDTEPHTVNPPPPPNQAPTAAFDPPSCTTGQPCQFTDASSDSDGTVEEWSWDFSDSGATSSLQNPSHTYTVGGTYTVKLRVKDNDGAQSDEVQHEVTVTDPSPPP